jgi:predicted phage terminase large subunit-like protein
MLSDDEILSVEREYCARSLLNFVKRAWHILEPGVELKTGWAIEAVCDHLEAVTDNEINRLLINIPPGCMKSLLVCVFWPAWEWGAKARPELRYISTAYKQDLAVRDSAKCRRLIQSEWYSRLWGIELTGDQNAKIKFENTKTGFREAIAFDSITGSRGDRVLIDDPLSVRQARSAVDLKSAEVAFTEALPTRVNNDKSAIVVIMQRLHENDTSGIILKREFDYTHLCLPMRFERDRRCVTKIGFSDPRQTDGELLFPERFSEEIVSELERTLGSYAAAGQFQQRPAPRDGGMFKKSWFPIVRAVQAGTRFVRGWDLAATEGAGDWTVGVKIGRQKDGRFIIAHIARDQLSPAGVERLLVNTASHDGYTTEISLPQDPGQAGKQQAAYYIQKMAGYIAHATTESGSKEVRASPFAAQAEVGNVDILEGGWNDIFFDELCVFPGGAYDDQVDAASRALNVLAAGSKFDLGTMT